MKNNSDKPKAPDQESLLAGMKDDARAIFLAGLDAAGAKTAIDQACRLEQNHFWIGKHSFDLADIDRILVIGAGKATAVMAKAIENILCHRITDGIISVKYNHIVPLDHIQILEAGHPVPDENGIKASQAIMNLAAGATENDLILCLLSGGGSALLPLPATPLTLQDKQAATTLLLGCGATIQETNALRKHLSAIKGGRLAKAAVPAAMINLVLSDVVGDDLEVIASGPGVPDDTTFTDCLQIIHKYDLKKRLPKTVLNHLKQGINGHIDETPKSGTDFFNRTNSFIIGSNRQALAACEKLASRRGYNTLILSSFIEGDTHTAARIHTAIAKEILATGRPVACPACILSGGETTLTLKGDGHGGRNQEAALVAALEIHKSPETVMLCAGTDGTDGPTDAAGAIADTTTLERAKKAGLDPQSHLDNNNAYPFFKTLGDLVITGPTGTNVMDLNILLVRK
jgi:hydroxypyruvate reductase